MTPLFALGCFVAGVLLGWILAAWRSRRVIRAQAVRLERAAEEARRDAPTGIWNRKAFDENLAIQMAISRRYASPLSVLLIDVDRFKEVNDRAGHAAGDAALQWLARTLLESARASDLVTRFGGDEFALILPQTDGAGAAALAERLRGEVAKPQAVGSPSITISVGAATLAGDEDAGALVERADRALYQAKRSIGDDIRTP